MKVLVSLGPIIGVVVWAVYCACVQLYGAVKGKDAVKKKTVYISVCVMAVIEVVLILITIIVPRVSDESYRIGNMTIGGYIVNTPTKFKVSYIESGRRYSNRIKLNEEELANIRAVCSSDEGTVFLRIAQEDKLETIDITNADILLDMSGFEAGHIRFTVVNEDARNVKFELIW